MVFRAKSHLPTCIAAAVALAALTPLVASAPAAPVVGGQGGQPSSVERALLHSHSLWATIDVCSPPGQLNTVGIRGSMPGNSQPHDTMYMSFRLQYEDDEKHWLDLSGGGSSGWVSVGRAGSPRQGGTSFALKPVAGKPAVTLRGVVDFQWRRGAKVLVDATETTSAGHRSLAGADPANFSAATCVLG